MLFLILTYNFILFINHFLVLFKQTGIIFDFFSYRCFFYCCLNGFITILMMLLNCLSLSMFAHLVFELFKKFPILLSTVLYLPLSFLKFNFHYLDFSLKPYNFLWFLLIEVYCFLNSSLFCRELLQLFFVRFKFFL